MRSYGRTSVHEFLGDFVVFRNLIPVDERLPSLQDVRGRAGIGAGVTPRKSQPAYARVIVELLKAARRVTAPEATLEQLIYVGDTRMNDGTAFANIAAAGGWPGLAFIASEKADPGPPETVHVDEGHTGTLFLADRWADLGEFQAFCSEQSVPIDERTVVIVDLDKTAVGARGRNDHVINRARVDAVRRTVGDLLGDAYDEEAFKTAYDALNQSEFHNFTADNQDYLAYICLILGAELCQLEPLMGRVRAGRLDSFGSFIDEINDRNDELPPSLRDIHRRIYRRVQAGDPTPFKAFRYNEFHATVERMGCLSDQAPVEELLAAEIVVTQEVREAALRWRARGALLFGLSDKPDEASIPTEPLAEEGFLPIHRVETHAVGQA
jgi:hypothetical protein